MTRSAATPRWPRAAAAGHGDGLYGYVVADPTDLDSSADQLRRYLDAPGVLGVKVHGEWSGTPTTAPAMSDLFDLLARFGRPVKIHNTGGRLGRRPHRDRPPSSAPADRDRPWRPRDAERGGCSRRGRDRQRPPRVLEQLRQPARRFAQAVAIAGPERLMWGSDAPLLEPAFVLGTYLDAGLAPDALERVFWGNAATLYGV